MIPARQYLLLALVLLSGLTINALAPASCAIRRPNHYLPSSQHNGRLHSLQHPRYRSVSQRRASTVELSDNALETRIDKDSANLPSPPTPPEDEELDLSKKVINFVFLAAAFGYAAYTIFSIDSGLTRGWTPSEIAMRIPLDNWGAYEDYLANKPIFTKTLINVIIYLLGDWLSQTAFQGKNVLDFDISRTMRNGFIGLCFGPLVHEYYQFSDTILPPENGLVTRLEKILMDQTLYLTIKCSIYISAVGLLNGDDWPTVKETVKDKIGGIVITAWKFWPLVHCVTYGLIPARHRILWVNSVDLVWNAILATQAQKTDPEEEGELVGEGQDQVLNLMLEGSSEEATMKDGNHLVVVKDQLIESEEALVAEILSPSNGDLLAKPGRNMTAEAITV